jgi:fibro-slime domain-containing protein
VWVFVNNVLVIDLGGTHEPETQTVEMDTVAAELGMRHGQTYPIDFFHAERHTTLSNFQLKSNLSYTRCSF